MVARDPLQPQPDSSERDRRIRQHPPASAPIVSEGSEPRPAPPPSRALTARRCANTPSKVLWPRSHRVRSKRSATHAVPRATPVVVRRSFETSRARCACPLFLPGAPHRHRQPVASALSRRTAARARCAVARGHRARAAVAAASPAARAPRPRRRRSSPCQTMGERRGAAVARPSFTPRRPSRRATPLASATDDGHSAAQYGSASSLPISTYMSSTSSSDLGRTT